MDIVGLLIQLVSGAVGGNAAGAAFKKYSLGPIGNTIAGVLGGGIGGQFAGALVEAGISSGGADLGSILSDVAGGGVGGAVLMVLVGVIRKMMTK
jgi:uncharacterized membrane-anchored protein YitT (DUF2179 family)